MHVIYNKNWIGGEKCLYLIFHLAWNNDTDLTMQLNYLLRPNISCTIFQEMTCLSPSSFFFQQCYSQEVTTGIQESVFTKSCHTYCHPICYYYARVYKQGKVWSVNYLLCVSACSVCEYMHVPLLMLLFRHSRWIWFDLVLFAYDGFLKTVQPPGKPQLKTLSLHRHTLLCIF